MEDKIHSKPMFPENLSSEKRIVNLIVLVNNIDRSNEYLDRIIHLKLGITDDQIDDIEHHHSLKNEFLFNNDALKHLNRSFSSKATNLLNDNLQVLFNQVIRPQIQHILTTSLRDADYRLPRDELGEIAGQSENGMMPEQVASQFRNGWETLMKPLSRIMTPRT
ncbi:hypothetical protein F5884DRAFT_314025 [Xylogone sp. PMI_703]|nr:hypothetical protein F5884DRAFT_314025 [Xylogone sp. PMI_703]